jgi:hypothetical protein
MSKVTEKLIVDGAGKLNMAVGYSCTAKPHQGKRATGILLLQQGMEILSGELSEDEWEMLDALVARLQGWGVE